MTIELDPQQLEAVNKLQNGNVLCGVVGSGKSRPAVAYYFLKECKGSIPINGEGEHRKMKTPKDLYIITTAKKRESLDWETECIKFGIPRTRDESYHGATVTVDSWNNIAKYAHIKDAFFIFDEQRLVGSGTWVKAFLKIAKLNRWILLSATPGDTWMDYVPVFLANGFYKNRTEFTNTHVIYSRFAKYPKVERFIATGRMEKYRRSILVDMPYVRATVRHQEVIRVPYDQELFTKVLKGRWHVYEERPIREVGELCYVMRKVVNSHQSRVDAIVELAKDHPRLIVFYNFNYELDILRTLGERLQIPMTEWNGQNHQAIPDAERWIYLVQYTAGAEGWNCTSTDTIVFYSLNYSYKIVQQAMGRIDRRDTEYVDLYYFTFRSDSQIDLSIMKSLHGKKNFNERAFASLLAAQK